MYLCHPDIRVRFLKTDMFKIMGRNRIKEFPEHYGKPLGRPPGTTGIKRRVKENKKVKCHFSISMEVNDILNTLSEKTGLSKSAIVEQSVILFSKENS